MTTLGCKYCEGEQEPGFIEMDNNGPIVACPVCNADYDTPQKRREREYEAALRARAKMEAGHG